MTSNNHRKIRERLDEIENERTQLSNQIDKLHGKILFLRSKKNRLQEEANAMIFEMANIQKTNTKQRRKK